MKFLWIAVLSTALVGCGDDEPTPASALEGGTSSALSQTPSATGEVTSNALTAVIMNQALSTSGLALSAAGSTVNFSSGQSTAMCETANVMKSILSEAAQPDTILCYLRAMADLNVVSSGLADGNFHYVRLINLPSGEEASSNATPRVKFKIELAGGNVKRFTMFTCFSGTTAAPAQSEYIDVNNSTTATLTSKYSGQSGSNTYGSSIVVRGTIRNGAWVTSKTVEATQYNSNGSNSSNMVVNGTQTADSFNFTATRKGTVSIGSGSVGTFADAFGCVTQILNDNQMSTFAIGDGTCKFDLNFSSTGGSAQTYNPPVQTESWIGDTRQEQTPATGGAFYAEANALTLPTVPASVSAISFSGDEVWDCSLPSGETWVDADFSTAPGFQARMNTCNSTLTVGRDWVDCSSTYQ